jgi:hypothetical protein
MRYEVIDGDGLQKIIKIAGGPVSNASPDFVQIERNEGDSIRLMEYKLNDVIAGKYLWYSSMGIPSESEM